jgi:hypothetical protein
VTTPLITARAWREPDPGPFWGVPEWFWTALEGWLEDLLDPDRASGTPTLCAE